MVQFEIFEGIRKPISPSEKLLEHRYAGIQRGPMDKNDPCFRERIENEVQVLEVERHFINEKRLTFGSERNGI